MTRASTEQELTAILEGVTSTALGQIFALDHKEVNKRLVGKVTPVPNVGKDKFVRYRIRDAAPFLVDYKLDPEEYLKNLSPSKLPPPLQDAFWKALLSRQKYEENKGDLWRTERVFEVVSNAFKVLRLTILMFVDNVSQQTHLTDQQRDIIQKLSDGLLASLNTALVEKFENHVPAVDEHGKPLVEEAGDQTITVHQGDEDETSEEESDDSANW